MLAIPVGLIRRSIIVALNIQKDPCTDLFMNRDSGSHASSSMENRSVKNAKGSAKGSLSGVNIKPSPIGCRFRALGGLGL